ncbi:MAG: hypothetical protein AAF467_04340 [Actinomycetota bacterium]
MGEALHDGPDRGARALIRVAEPFHAITYYSPEMADLTAYGYKGWWHAYFGYRPAPMGAVNAGAVTAAFYNFAPRMVERAVPGVWAIRSPEATVALRLERVQAAIGRIFADGAFADEIRSAVDLLRPAVEGCAAEGRPVYAAYDELAWPDEPTLALWHATTLVREHRGDSHNLALAAAGVDAVSSHVLMAGRGHGNQPTITAIRGFTDDEWAAGVDRLVARGWAEPDGSLTSSGLEGRSAIERHTDELASAPAERLGVAGVDHVVGFLGPIVNHLRDSGEVSGAWPPPHLLKPA